MKDYNPMDKDGDYRLDKDFEKYFAEHAAERKSQALSTMGVIYVFAAILCIGIGVFSQQYLPFGILLGVLSFACGAFFAFGPHMITGVTDNKVKDILNTDDVKVDSYIDHHFMRDMVNIDKFVLQIGPVMKIIMFIIGALLPYLAAYAISLYL